MLILTLQDGKVEKAIVCCLHSTKGVYSLDNNVKLVGTPSMTSFLPEPSPSCQSFKEGHTSDVLVKSPLNPRIQNQRLTKEDIDKIQVRTMKIAFPNLDYVCALNECSINRNIHQPQCRMKNVNEKFLCGAD